MKRSSIFIVNDTSFSFNKQFEVNFDGSEIFLMAACFSFLPPYCIDGCRFFFVWWKIKRKYGRVEVYSIISGGSQPCRQEGASHVSAVRQER